MLQASPQAEKLLARLHDSHRLYSLAQSPEASARAELAQTMSDLLQINLSVSELELITDILMELLRKAEIDLRRAVAERLSVMEEIPLRMILSLANDEIEVADPVLRRSRVLSDIDLIYIIKSHGVAHAQSVALRPDISLQLVEVLIENKDHKTALNLTQNQNIQLPDWLMNKINQIVGEEIKVFADAVSDEADFIHDVIDDVVHDVSKSQNGYHVPSSTMMALAESLLAQGALKPSTMIDNLRRGQDAEFIAMFAVYCSLPKTKSLEILKQKDGKDLTIACKACDFTKAEFVNIYLMTSKLRNNEIITERMLANALAHFDNVDVLEARTILKQFRH